MKATFIAADLHDNNYNFYWAVRMGKWTVGYLAEMCTLHYYGYRLVEYFKNKGIEIVQTAMDNTIMLQARCLCPLSNLSRGISI